MERRRGRGQRRRFPRRRPEPQRSAHGQHRDRRGPERRAVPASAVGLGGRSGAGRKARVGGSPGDAGRGLRRARRGRGSSVGPSPNASRATVGVGRGVSGPAGEGRHARGVPRLDHAPGRTPPPTRKRSSASLARALPQHGITSEAGSAAAPRALEGRRLLEVLEDRRDRRLARGTARGP